MNGQYEIMKLQVLIAVDINIKIFWNATSWSLADRSSSERN
jgi:hypothetical protein